MCGTGGQMHIPSITEHRTMHIFAARAGQRCAAHLDLLGLLAQLLLCAPAAALALRPARGAQHVRVRRLLCHEIAVS